MHRPRAPATYIKKELEKLQQLRKSHSVHLETLCWKNHPLLWPSKELVNDRKHAEYVRRLEYRISQMDMSLLSTEEKLSISNCSEPGEHSLFRLTELSLTERI